MIYKMMKLEDIMFPKPIKVGESALWLEGEIIEWKARYIERFRHQNGSDA